MDRDRFNRAFDYMVSNRSDSINPIIAARRLLLLSLAQASSGRHGDALATMRKAEIFLSRRKSTRDRVTIIILRSWSGLVSNAISLGNALTLLETALRLLSEKDSPGRIVSLLTTWSTFGQRLFYHNNRYNDGLQLLKGGAKIEYLKDFRNLASLMLITPVRMLNDLNLNRRVILEGRAVMETVGNAHEDLKTAREILEMPNEEEISPNVELIKMEVRSMAELGASWSDISPRLDELNRLLPPHGKSSIGVSWESLKREVTIIAALARSDIGVAERVAANSDNPFWKRALSRARGDRRSLGDLELEIKTYSRNLIEVEERKDPNDPYSGFEAKGNAALLRQQIAQTRELYIEYCAALGVPRHAREQLAAWKVDALTSNIAARQPWRSQILEGQVLEAERNLAEASSVYDRLIEDLRRQFFSGQSRNLHYRYIRVLRGAYLGSARTEWDLGSGKADAALMKALDRVDELRWLEGERQLFGGSERPLYPLPDLGELARGLGEDGVLMALAELDRPPEVVVWVFSVGQGLRAKTFRPNQGELLFLEALNRHVNFGEISPLLASLAEWLASEIPPGVPVALAVDGRSRKHGIHLLAIDKTPLVLRNSVTIIPSLRSLAEVQRLEAKGRGAYVVGLPLDDSEIDVVGQVAPMSDQRRLCQLAREMRATNFLWNDEVNHEKLAEVLRIGSRVHISTHGRVDSIDVTQTGLKVFGENEFFHVERSREVSLPGSLVVLSACQVGNWGDPDASTTTALDLLFLTRGATNVVSAAGSIDANVAGSWMEEFHAALNEGNTPMWAAQRAYAVTRDRHPNEDWGAFTVVGSGVGRFDSTTEGGELKACTGLEGD